MNVLSNATTLTTFAPAATETVYPNGLSGALMLPAVDASNVSLTLAAVGGDCAVSSPVALTIPAGRTVLLVGAGVWSTATTLTAFAPSGFGASLIVTRGTVTQTQAFN